MWSVRDAGAHRKRINSRKRDKKPGFYLRPRRNDDEIKDGDRYRPADESMLLDKLFASIEREQKQGN